VNARPLLPQGLRVVTIGVAASASCKARLRSCGRRRTSIDAAGLLEPRSYRRLPSPLPNACDNPRSLLGAPRLRRRNLRVRHPGDVFQPNPSRSPSASAGETARSTQTDSAFRSSSIAFAEPFRDKLERLALVPSKWRLSGRLSPRLDGVRRNDRARRRGAWRRFASDRSAPLDFTVNSGYDDMLQR